MANQPTSSWGHGLGVWHFCTFVSEYVCVKREDRRGRIRMYAYIKAVTKKERLTGADWRVG